MEILIYLTWPQFFGILPNSVAIWPGNYNPNETQDLRSLHFLSLGSLFWRQGSHDVRKAKDPNWTGSKGLLVNKPQPNSSSDRTPSFFEIGSCWFIPNWPKNSESWCPHPADAGMTGVSSHIWPLPSVQADHLVPVESYKLEWMHRSIHTPDQGAN